MPTTYEQQYAALESQLGKDKAEELFAAARKRTGKSYLPFETRFNLVKTALEKQKAKPAPAVAAKPAPTKSDLWRQYHALPVEQRNAFYQKHRNQLRG